MTFLTIENLFLLKIVVTLSAQHHMKWDNHRVKAMACNRHHHMPDSVSERRTAMHQTTILLHTIRTHSNPSMSIQPSTTPSRPVLSDIQISILTVTLVLAMITIHSHTKCTSQHMRISQRTQRFNPIKTHCKHITIHTNRSIQRKTVINSLCKHIQQPIHRIQQRTQQLPPTSVRTRILLPLATLLEPATTGVRTSVKFLLLKFF